MDALSALKAEIAKKRKLVGGDSTSASGGKPAKRWRVRADIEEERRRQYLAREKEDAKKRKREAERKWRESRVDMALDSSASLERTPKAPDNLSNTEEVGAGSELHADMDPSIAELEGDPPLSRQEVIKRLRVLKEPATLFGESLWDRFNRMRELELAREEVSKGQRNVFQKKLREMQAKDVEDDIYRYTGSKMPHLDPKTGSKQEHHGVDAEEGETPSCKEDYVYLQLRKYMRLWASEIDSMSKEERRTMKGRSLVVTYEQTKDWLRPLYKLLRKRKLVKNILDALKNIFEAASEREYVRANSLYLEQLAIGKAPWPMGATMVGIHARAAREKIGEDKIAHVMNDEETRKYIQAVKRLLTVAQKHFPTSFSKMIL